MYTTKKEDEILMKCPGKRENLTNLGAEKHNLQAKTTKEREQFLGMTTNKRN